ncbi:hypothetical protein BHE74_00005401 [Ensete ventricosum]|nr:hypothetical protein BHE74_00005401 [Ensete ventricosum]RZR81272.1 hypothetical protein BHM03_00007465 [Ensete ventricosum]
MLRAVASLGSTSKSIGPLLGESNLVGDNCCCGGGRLGSEAVVLLVLMRWHPAAPTDTGICRRNEKRINYARKRRTQPHQDSNYHDRAQGDQGSPAVLLTPLGSGSKLEPSLQEPAPSDNLPTSRNRKDDRY